jgi:nucleoside-diphosphate-sugar epimerase
MEEPVTSGRFTNVYEESKAQAEKTIASRCEAEGIPLTVLRPSIVCGHSITGKALKFNALYYAVRSLSYIRDIFVKDLTDRGGERSRKWGFRLDEDGILSMPLEIYLKNRGTVNLIPVDHFVEILLRIVEHPESGGFYHITNDEAPDIEMLMEYAERFLGIRGVRALWRPPDREPNPAEELFDRLMEPYRPYLTDSRTYDRSRAKSLTQGISAPHFTYEMFERCMTYAVGCDWGIPGEKTKHGGQNTTATALQ